MSTSIPLWVPSTEGRPTPATRILNGDSMCVVDAVIVGSGAGGAAAARTLAQKGLKVLVVEEGRRLTQKDFRGKDMMWALSNLYRDKGLQMFQGAVTAPLPAGRVVGGGTVVNSAICFRAPAQRLGEWRNAGATWMTDERMAALYDEVESTIGVVETSPALARNNNLIFLRGAEKLGLERGFIRRNAPGCQGCGVCEKGCPSGGKWSVDKNYLLQAEEAGAGVLPGARATTLRMQGKECRGVELELLDENGNPTRTVTVTARHTILSAGAIGTPLVLLRNGVGTDSGHVGEHLAIHPGFSALGMFEEEVKVWSGVPQGAYAHLPGIPDALVETFNVGADIYYLFMGAVGAPSLERMKRANHIGSAGAMLRDRNVGRVRLGSNGRADIHYELADEDRRTAIESLKWLVRIHFAAGATEVLPGRKGVDFKRNEKDALEVLTADMKATDFLQMYGSHPMSTCRMSANPSDGVVAPDGSVHGTRGLYVMDGSIFPSALGVNPQMTIMGMAMHLAGALT